MTNSDLPYKPTEDVRRFQVSANVMCKRGYNEPANALCGRRYTDGVQIPALSDEAPWMARGDRKDVLLAIYSEACSGWRTLTDVRFKLLGLLPAVSVAVLISIFGKGDAGYSLGPIEQGVIGLFGLLITGALYVYEKRNSELYNDLIGRGRQIEAELGIHTGHFRGRPEARGIIRHGVGIAGVYLSCALAWAGVAAVALARVVRLWS